MRKMPRSKFAVRIVLQDRNSLLYVKKKGEWTPRIKEARDFRHCHTAFAFAHRTGLPKLDAVMTFGDPKYDLRVRASR
jgi:hypothetical protein